MLWGWGGGLYQQFLENNKYYSKSKPYYLAERWGMHIGFPKVFAPKRMQLTRQEYKIRSPISHPESLGITIFAHHTTCQNRSGIRTDGRTRIHTHTQVHTHVCRCVVCVSVCMIRFISMHINLCFNALS